MPEVFGFECIVNAAGPAADGAEGPNPVIYLNLTDLAGNFYQDWFFASDAAKREILAVALAAITTQKPVNATIDPPNPDNNPYTQVFRLYLLNKTVSLHADLGN